MKRFMLAITKRLLVSVAIVISVMAVGLLCGRFLGPSKAAYFGALLLVAWPWVLPQVFVVVSVVWFAVDRVRERH